MIARSALVSATGWAVRRAAVGARPTSAALAPASASGLRFASTDNKDAPRSQSPPAQPGEVKKELSIPFISPLMSPSPSPLSPHYDGYTQLPSANAGTATP